VHRTDGHFPGELGLADYCLIHFLQWTSVCSEIKLLG